MRKNIIITLIFFLITCTVTYAGVDFYYENNIYINNDVFYINDLFNQKLSGSYIENRDLDFIYNNEERYLFYIDDIKFTIGYFKRLDERVFVNKELIELIKKDDKLGSSQINLKRSRLNYEGIIVQKELFSNNKVKLKIIGELINGKDIDERYYMGDVLYKDNNYTFSGKNQELNSNISKQTTMNDVNFSSTGYSLGCNVIYKINDYLDLKFSGQDLINMIKWKDVYIMEGNFDSDNININDNGYLEYDSIFNYNYRYTDYITRFKPQYNLSLNAKKGSIGFQYKYKLYPYFEYDLVNSYVFSKPIIVKIGIIDDYYIFRLSYWNFNIDMMTKNLNINKSTGVGVSLRAGIDF